MLYSMLEPDAYEHLPHRRLRIVAEITVQLRNADIEKPRELLGSKRFLIMLSDMAYYVADIDHSPLLRCRYAFLPLRDDRRLAQKRGEQELPALLIRPILKQRGNPIEMPELLLPQGQNDSIRRRNLLQLTERPVKESDRLSEGGRFLSRQSRAQEKLIFPTTICHQTG